jgi:hypothetical protein
LKKIKKLSYAIISKLSKPHAVFEDQAKFHPKHQQKLMNLENVIIFGNKLEANQKKFNINTSFNQSVSRSFNNDH